jgi:MOSC domain-containing protein YiiM
MMAARYDGRVDLVEITGLRNPCLQLDRFQPGLLAAVLGGTSRGGSCERRVS